MINIAFVLTYPWFQETLRRYGDRLKAALGNAEIWTRQILRECPTDALSLRPGLALHLYHPAVLQMLWSRRQ